MARTSKRRTSRGMRRNSGDYGPSYGRYEALLNDAHQAAVLAQGQSIRAHTGALSNYPEAIAGEILEALASGFRFLSDAQRDAALLVCSMYDSGLDSDSKRHFRERGLEILRETREAQDRLLACLGHTDRRGRLKEE